MLWDEVGRAASFHEGFRSRVERILIAILWPGDRYDVEEPMMETSEAPSMRFVGS